MDNLRTACRRAGGDGGDADKNRQAERSDRADAGALAHGDSLQRRYRTGD